MGNFLIGKLELQSISLANQIKKFSNFQIGTLFENQKYLGSTIKNQVRQLENSKDYPQINTILWADWKKLSSSLACIAAKASN